MTKQATIASLQKQMETITNSVSSSMNSFRNQVTGMLGMSHGGKRSIYDVYGYPKTLSGDDGFKRMYQYSRRQGIANRITFGMAKSCWRDGFKIVQKNGEDKETDVLQDAMDALERAGFNRKIERADILNRIGRASVLFVGIPDGLEPSEPVGKVVSGEKNLELLYFTPYAYDGIQITKQEEDSKSPRYGLPKLYTLSRTSIDDNSKDVNYNSIVVHWSRVIHLNENALESDIEGMGALEPVFNDILNLDKVCGGSAEAYFRNAKGKTAYEIDPKATVGGFDKKAFDEGVEKYTNNFQDHTVALGTKVYTLDTPHHSPLDTVRVIMWIISGYSGIPIRVLTGEGGGQTTGSEDQLAYNHLVNDRQNLFCSAAVEDLLKILESAGMITLPEQYDIRFIPQEAATEKEVADIGKTKAETIASIIKSKSEVGGDNIDVEKALKVCGIDDEITDGELSEFKDEADLNDDGTEIGENE